MKKLLTIAAIALLIGCTKKETKPSGSGMSDAEMQSLLIDKKWQVQQMWGRDSTGNMIVDDLSTWPDYLKDNYTVWKGTMKYYESSNGTSSHGPVSDTADYGSWFLNNGTIHMNSEMNIPGQTTTHVPLNIAQITVNELTCWNKGVSQKADTVWFQLKTIP